MAANDPHLTVHSSDRNDSKAVSISDIQALIKVVRGQQVMLDTDLATLYGVTTKALNQAVKRNIQRFPEDFMIKLSKEEVMLCRHSVDTKTVASDNLRSQNVTSSWGGTRYLPYAFTEQGVAMLSSVLRSQTAIDVNISIMRAFVEMRRFLVNNAPVFQRLETVEFTQLQILQHQVESDRRIEEILLRLDRDNEQPTQGIFYDGQIYDAYTFVSDLVRQARSTIVLIDNYVDDTVLTLFDKRAAGVSASIYTQRITPQMRLDLTRHNAQYPKIDVHEFGQSHDRFLCIDDTVYHIGASIKDLGKKWFAFSKLEYTKPADLIKKINNFLKRK